jgi:hypothetical protein
VVRAPDRQYVIRAFPRGHGEFLRGQGEFKRGQQDFPRGNRDFPRGNRDCPPREPGLPARETGVPVRELVIPVPALVRTERETGLPPRIPQVPFAGRAEFSGRLVKPGRGGVDTEASAARGRAMSARHDRAAIVPPFTVPLPSSPDPKEPAMAVPKLDAPLAQWSTTFQSVASSDPGAFSLSVLQMAQYTMLHDAYIAAYDAAKAPGSKSKALVVGKDGAKKSLLAAAREYYGQIQASQNVTNEDKTRINVVIRGAQPTLVRPPAQAPLMSVVSVFGRAVRYRLADATAPGSRRKPLKAEGAIILSFVGATPPPPRDAGWKVEGQTGRTTFVVQFPDTVAPGQACWATAMWYNRRGAYSPACAPVQTYLPIGPLQAAA